MFKWIKGLWTRVKNFFGNLFGSKKTEAEVKAEPKPKSDAAIRFNVAYESAEKIDFNANWNNGTGYYDHAVDGEHAPKLALGQVVATKSPAKNNRRIILVGTPFGNAVMFERYSDDDSVLTRNVPDQLRDITTILSGDDVTFLLNAGNLSAKAA
jgi:hypothetical protein